MRRLWTVLILLAAAPASAAGTSDDGSFLGFPDPLWKSLNLVLFILVLVWLVGRPLGRFLRERRQGIHAQLAEARDRLAEAESLRQEIVERLARAETEVAEIRHRAQHGAEAEAEAIRTRADADADRFLSKVGREIERRRLEARRQLTEETAILAEQLARELLQSEMTDEDRRRVMDRSLEAIRRVDTEGS